MPTFELTGPDGGKYQVDAPDEGAALSAFQQFSGAAKPKPVGVTDLVRSAATGVPVIGGALNKLNAATNAALAPVVEPFLDKGPDTLDQPTFGERYSKSLELQDARDKQFATERPITDTMLKLTGGVASTIPAVLAAPKAFGAIGTLPQMVRNSTLSGAGLSSADAAVRGEDIPTAAAIGGGVGAAAPFLAKGIGKIAQAMRPAPAPVPQNVTRVGNTEVPLRPDQVVPDPKAAAEAELALRGGSGDRAQGVAQSFDDLQKTKLQEATSEISAALDPASVSAGTAPHDAGARVVRELVDLEAARLAGENAGVARTAAEGQALRTGVAQPPPIVGPAQPRIQPDSPASAAEAVGGGVADRRNAVVARRDDLYRQVREEPGTFDPEFVGGMSGDVRARIATGDDAVHVDPQTASKANEAIRILDSLNGTGLFHNAAARPPVGPVAQAAAKAGGGTEADRAYAELTAKGINPERARAAVASMDGGDRLRGSALDPHDVAMPNGTAVRVAPRVVEASSLKTSADEGYDKAFQPRDRARAASDMQINDIARNLNPSRLGVSSEADRGAPIIGSDLMVDSGNGRVLALRQAYAENGAAADRYRAWLRSQGVDVAKYREPVLVRERTTPMTREERKTFTVAANAPATLSMSAPERALADSRLLTPQTVSLIRNPADLGAAENLDFVRAFMSGVPAAEHGALATTNGELSAEGLTRVRNAVLGKAYGDTPVLTRIAESAHDDVKSISNGLTAAAPEWAALRARIASGEVPAALDVTRDLVDAVSRTARIRGKGVSLAESQAQADAFAKQSPESEALQRLFYQSDGKTAQSSAQIGNALRHYAQEASKVNAAPGLDLGMAPVSAADVLKTAAGRVGAPAELAQEVRHAAEVAASKAPAATGPAISEVGLREMDSARKRLVTLFGDAKAEALRGGDRSDMRAMGRILHEFDQAIIDAFDSGRFSGNAARAASLLRDARASHAAYRQTFSSRGTGDDIGRSVEKIIGRYHDTAATPDEIMALSYGSASDPGGGKAARVAQRLRVILGESSPEWGAYKQGLVDYVMNGPTAGRSLSASDRAARIDKFLTGDRGKVLANTVLSADERAAFGRHATNLRASEPVPVSSLDSVGKVIAKISGRDGNMPMGPGEVADLLLGKSMRTNKQLAVPVALTLKRDLSPESWTGLRQGMWERITNAGEGRPQFESAALARRISEFLDLDVAKVYFSGAERAQMKILAQVHRQMVQPKGTTNPSGSGYTIARIANKASSNLLAMLGAVHSGFPGLAVGYAAEKGLRGIGNARNARAAVRGFYGPQPAVPARSSRVPIVLSQASAPQVANQ